MSDLELKDKVICTLKGFNMDIEECTDFEVDRQKDKTTCMGAFKTSKNKERLIILDLINCNGQVAFTNLKTI